MSTSKDYIGNTKSIDFSPYVTSLDDTMAQ